MSILSELLRYDQRRTEAAAEAAAEADRIAAAQHAERVNDYWTHVQRAAADAAAVPVADLDELLGQLGIPRARLVADVEFAQALPVAAEANALHAAATAARTQRQPAIDRAQRDAEQLAERAKVAAAKAAQLLADADAAQHAERQRVAAAVRTAKDGARDAAARGCPWASVAAVVADLDSEIARRTAAEDEARAMNDEMNRLRAYASRFGGSVGRGADGWPVWQAPDPAKFVGMRMPPGPPPRQVPGAEVAK